MALNDWMGALDDGRKLNSLCIPGSHDACMYVVKAGDPLWRVDAAVTQFHTIGQQLTDGARYFDVRVYKDGGTLKAGHFQSKKKAQDGRGSFGPDFVTVCRDIAGFLGANNSECVLLKISIADDAIDDAVRMIEQELSGVLLETSSIKPLATYTLGQVRGKAIAAFDKVMLKGGGSFKKKLHIAVKKTPTADKYDEDIDSKRRSVLYLNGDAPQADSIKDVIKKQNSSRKKAIKKGLAEHMEMYYLTITASLKTAIAAGGLGIRSSKSKMCIADNTAREVGLTGVLAAPRPATACKYSGWQNGAGNQYKKLIQQVAGIGLPVNIFQYDFCNAEVNQVIVDRN